MFDYGLFKFESKQDLFDKAIRYWNPDKTKFWQKAGIDLVIDRREGYCLYDMSGRRLIDLHLNGGTYNFGHRHPELVETLKGALDYFDIGNHWFPSVARAALAESLIKVSPGMTYAVFAPGGAEAVDIAIKSARYATKRRKIVSIVKGYHGHSGFAVATGDDRFTKIFLSDQPETFIQVPFNDIDAMERALRGNDFAALIMETIPATYGFPMPKEGYLNACKALCEKHGAMYIADEVQTGLMRTGKMWGWQAYGVQPDIMVTAKGLSGGLYPISACLVNEKAGGWLNEDGAAHISTSGGAELGCIVAHKVIEMLLRPELVANVQTVTEFMARRHARDDGAPWRHLHRRAPEGRDPRPRIQSSGRRGLRFARALRARRVGDLLVPRQARAAMEAGRAADRRTPARTSWTASMPRCRVRANCCAVPRK